MTALLNTWVMAVFSGILTSSTTASAFLISPPTQWTTVSPVSACDESMMSHFPLRQRRGKCSMFLSTSISDQDIEERRLLNSELAEGLEDRFSRWRFLQDILDEEAPADRVNRMLYWNIYEFLNCPPDDDDNEEKPLPERTDELLAQLQEALDHVSESESFAILTDLEDDNEVDKAMETHLNALLPDPRDQEDEDKSLWHIVMEIHGEESVKINDQEGRIKWQRCCLVARLLVRFDFLTNALITSSVQK